MTTINYPRHFALLALGAILVFASRQRPVDISVFLVSNGFLHASALVLALKGPATWLRRAIFAAIAAGLSASVLYTAIVLPPAGYHFVGFSFASAIGAGAYWCLVRSFWLRELTTVSLLRAVVLCAAVTLAWETATDFSLSLMGDPLISTVHTLCWWLAFSFSLYLGGARRGLPSTDRHQQ
jgi:hypothetical protein